MKAELKESLKKTSGFFERKEVRRLLYLLILGALAAGEFFYVGLARRTFVFHSIYDGSPMVEDRMLRRSVSGEIDIRRYVEEALLGPVSLDAQPLFPRETKLRSLMYREGVVYADLSEGAALPLTEQGTVYQSLHTLNTGIRRNFPKVEDVRLFITGNEAFPEKFRSLSSGNMQ